MSGKTWHYSFRKATHTHDNLELLNYHQICDFVLNVACLSYIIVIHVISNRKHKKRGRNISIAVTTSATRDSKNTREAKISAKSTDKKDLNLLTGGFKVLHVMTQRHRIALTASIRTWSLWTAIERKCRWKRVGRRLILLSYKRMHDLFNRWHRGSNDRRLASLMSRQARIVIAGQHALLLLVCTALCLRLHSNIIC